ncbi:MAG: hypothetical protein COB09_18505 [Thalassobium sp.]|nr:MAG: hypothetical protein COB09_18505 [Thalassobium sp.]
MSNEFRIRITIDPSAAVTGTRVVERRLNSLEMTANRLRRAMNTVFFFAGAGVGIKKLSDLADSYTTLQNRIRTVTDNQEELTAVTGELFRISNLTRQSFETTATVYARTAAATKNLGLSQAETLRFTESLNKAVALSGATATEAGNALIQFSQGMASGTLRGDELRSVLEQLPKVADVIAESFEVGRGELREYAAMGLITSKQIIVAFREAGKSLDEDFLKSIPTISQAFDVLRNNVLQAVGGFSTAHGITETLAKTIIFLSDNLDQLTNGAQAAGITLSIIFAKQGVGAAIKGVQRLTFVLATNPFVVLGVGIAAAIGYLIAFRDEISISGDGLITLGDAATATVNVIQTEFAFVGQFVGEAFDTVVNTVKGTMEALIQIIGTTPDALINAARIGANGVIGIFVALGKAIPLTLAGLPSALGDIFVLMVNSSISDIEKLINFSIDGINFVRDLAGLDLFSKADLGRIENKFTGAAAGLGTAIQKTFVDSITFDYIGTAVDKITAETLKVSEARRKSELEAEQKQAEEIAKLKRDKEARDGISSKAFDTYLANLTKEAEVLGRTSKEREIAIELERINQKTKFRLSESQLAAVEVQLRANQTMGEYNTILRDLREPQEELITQEKALIALRAEGLISVNEMTTGMHALQVAQAELAVSKGEGSFTDAIVVGLQEVIGKTESMQAALTGAFGAAGLAFKESIGDALTQAIVNGENFSDTMRNAASTITQELLSAVIQIGIEQAANFVQAQLFGTGMQAITVAQGATAAAVSTSTTAVVAANNTATLTTALPAATAQAGATFGASAAAGLAAVIALMAFASSNVFADGGRVRGPGGSRSDDIPAMLSNGEFVVNAKAAKENEAMLQRMNRGETLRLAGGGSVSTSEDSSAKTGTIGGEVQQQAGGGDVAVINVVDVDSMIAALGTAAGKRVMINTIRTDKAAFKAALGV